MADKYVKTFKIGEETYDVISANDNEQNTKIEALELDLAETKERLDSLQEAYDAFVELVDTKLAEMQSKIDYDEQDNGNDQSSSDD